VREDCPRCGNPVDDGAEWCPSCHAYLWDDDEPGERELVAPAAPPRAEGAEAEPTPTEPDPAPATLELPEARACPRCDTENPLERHFCRHCGLEFDPPRVSVPQAEVTPRASWWRRLLGLHRSPTERAALRTYRRSLPLRYRLIRTGGILALVALLVVGFLLLRSDPVTWASDRWYDLRDTLEPVRATAELDPPGPERPQFGPGLALDGAPGTAWGTSWIEASGAGDCGTQRTSAGLLLTFPDGPADLRRVRVLGGLPAEDDDRLLQWRPRVLELRFSDGTCQRVTLEDLGAPQDVDLEAPVSTTSLRVDVAEVFPRHAGENDVVAISELVPLARPAD